MIRKTLRSQSVVTTSVQDEKSRQLKRQSFDSGSTGCKGVVAGIAALGNLMSMTCHVQGLKASELLCDTGQPPPSTTSKVSIRTESDKNRQRRNVSCSKISEVSTMHVGRHMSVPHVTPLTSPAVSVSSHNPSRRLTLPTGNFTHKLFQIRILKWWHHHKMFPVGTQNLGTEVLYDAGVGWKCSPITQGSLHFKGGLLVIGLWARGSTNI